MKHPRNANPVEKRDEGADPRCRPLRDPAAARTGGPIADALGQLRDLVDAVGKSAEDLTARIEPVLEMEPPPPPDTNPRAVDDGGGLLLGQMRDLQAHLVKIHERIERVASRVQL